MPAIINTLIPPQSYEVIRERIVTVLGTELANQYDLDNTYPNVSRVWMERFVPFDSELEMPTVNVSIHTGEYDNRTLLKADGSYIYNIDVYTSAASTDTDDADKLAIAQMTKIAGMVMAILRNPGYNTLLFAPGLVIRTTVLSFIVGDKSTVRDALSDVVGRIQFMVQAVEQVQLSSGNALQLSGTTVYLNVDDTAGYYFQANTTV